MIVTSTHLHLELELTRLIVLDIGTMLLKVQHLYKANTIGHCFQQTIFISLDVFCHWYKSIQLLDGCNDDTIIVTEQNIPGIYDDAATYDRNLGLAG